MVSPKFTHVECNGNQDGGAVLTGRQLTLLCMVRAAEFAEHLLCASSSV